jgi:hypothetical protein
VSDALKTGEASVLFGGFAPSYSSSDEICP